MSVVNAENTKATTLFEQRAQTPRTLLYTLLIPQMQVFVKCFPALILRTMFSAGFIVVHAGALFEIVLEYGCPFLEYLIIGKQVI